MKITTIEEKKVYLERLRNLWDKTYELVNKVRGYKKDAGVFDRVIVWDWEYLNRHKRCDRFLSQIPQIAEIVEPIDPNLIHKYCKKGECRYTANGDCQGPVL